MYTKSPVGFRCVPAGGGGGARATKALSPLKFIVSKFEPLNLGACPRLASLTFLVAEWRSLRRSNPVRSDRPHFVAQSRTLSVSRVIGASRANSSVGRDSCRALTSLPVRIPGLDRVSPHPFWLRLRRAAPSRRIAFLFAFVLSALVTSAQDFDLVIANGRVMDPASGLDAVRHLGVARGSIVAITETALTGRAVIDAQGLVVAPGFIDLHQHGQTQEDYRYKALDGVTTVLELEVGTADVARWYQEREQKSPIHFGVSVGHIQVRMAVMGDRPDFLPPAHANGAVQVATESQIEELKQQIERGLQQGAVAVGFGIQYTPSATPWEILEMFRVAAKHRASCHVHLRSKRDQDLERSISGLEEIIAAAAITGAPLHVVHVQSSGGRSTHRLLQMIEEARAHGLDATTECYPYAAGMTDIRSAIFDDGWQKLMGIDYQNLQWPATGERLTAESFARYRKIGGLVIAHTNPEEVVRLAVANPLTMIASDGFLQHPRGAGTYARVLGHYAREVKALSLMAALRKMTIMPAQRLEQRAPMMKKKGRIQVGADADLTIFDAERIIDRSTYEKPAQPSDGIRFVLVQGVPVVRDRQFQTSLTPGRAVRASIP
ncbi:MAG: amidohydrolase family protein [Verrucomicrobia bacterium]|nr:amidohydrolase family protein [Verrucomicrobiota bacterium]